VKINYEAAADQLGEGIHTSLRKFAESPKSDDAWRAIRDMPNDEWNRICQFVAPYVVNAALPADDLFTIDLSGSFDIGANDSWEELFKEAIDEGLLVRAERGTP